jgi:hypothetical protein
MIGKSRGEFPLPLGSYLMDVLLLLVLVLVLLGERLVNG